MSGKTSEKDDVIEPVILPDGYQPSQDEEFMNPNQREYFRQKLIRWRTELLDEANQTITNLSTESLHKPDQMDRAQIESNAALDLRTRDRERKLIQKIESALRRIDDGTWRHFCTSPLHPRRTQWPCLRAHCRK